MAASAPCASPSRVISASPRVMIEACELSPIPIPLAMPTASAMTFFTAPPTSTPNTSVFVYGRKYVVRQTCCSFSATPSSAQATTLAAGCRRAISFARFGPDTTAMRSGPAPVTSAMTSLIRRVVPSSIPFIRLTRTQSGGRSETHVLRLLRSVCDGTARTTTSAPRRASAASEVAATVSGSGIPGR